VARELLMGEKEIISHARPGLFKNHI